MNKCYVYQYLDPRTNLPFYIGRGSKPSRKFSHLKEAKSQTKKFSNSRKINRIRDIWETGLNPIIEIVHANLSAVEAHNKECALIIKYGREHIDKNGLLTNILIDSNLQSLTGKTLEEIYGKARAKEIKIANSKAQTKLAKKNSAKQRKALSDGLKQWWINNPDKKLVLAERNKTNEHRKKLRKPKTITEETKLRLSKLRRENRLGKKHSKQTRIKLSNSKKGKNNPFYGKKLTESHKEKIRLTLLNKTISQRKTWIILFNKKEIIIDNLGIFCKETGLIYSSFIGALRANRSYKGYTLVRTIIQ